jgi:hypothetical protein
VRELDLAGDDRVVAGHVRLRGAAPRRSSFVWSQSSLALEDFRWIALTVCLIKGATAHGVIAIGASRPLAFRSATRFILRR